METILEFETIDSTSSYLKRNYQALPHLTIVRADYQTQGRGQFDRVWDANQGQNLLMSVLMKSVKIDDIDQLKMQFIAGLKHILKTFGIHVTFKKPNDLYVHDHKICGILLETKTVKTQLEYVIIGIGLNVNQTLFGAYQATSMKNELSKNIEVSLVFKQVIQMIKHSI